MKGHITVFLCLIMTVTCSLVYTIVEGCQMQALKWKMEVRTELDTNYVLSYYDTMLHEKYGLFFLSGMDSKNLSNLLADCSEESGKRQADSSDYLGMEITDIVVDKVLLATDENGRPFFDQAVKEEYQYLGEDVSSLVEDFLSWTNLLEKADKKETEGEEIKNQEVEIDPETKIDKAEKKKAEKLTNPADVAEELKEDQNECWFGDASVSKKKVKTSTSLTKRKKAKGNLTYGAEKSTSQIDNVLFLSYLMRHFATYNEPNEEGALSYEIEYILKGKNSDKKNIESVAMDILAIREACNFLYLISNQEMKQQAGVLATALTGYLGNVAITKVTEYLILFAWAGAEGVLDVKNLLQGEAVPLMKNVDTWQLSLTGMTDTSSIMGERKEAEDGLVYDDYLKMLLYSSGRQKLIWRAMDVMEWEIQRITDNTDFKMDKCVGGFQTTYQFESRGQDFVYEKITGY